MTDQDAYRRYTAEAEAVLTKAAGNMGSQERFSLVALGNAWAQLALAAAQDRVMPADRPTDDGNGLEVGFIVVDNEMVKPTEAAHAHKVILTDDRGRKWRIAAGSESLRWEAVQADDRDQPYRVRDGEGDEWVHQGHGRYLLAFDRARSRDRSGTTPLGLESIAARYGGYTETP